MVSLLHPLHALLVVQTAAFLYYVEQHPETPGWLVGGGHFAVATAFVVAAGLTTAAAPAGSAEPVSYVFAAVTLGAVMFVVFAVAPLVLATMLRRKRKVELGRGMERTG